MTSRKTWFITGSSRGFGREWATAALERGDAVAATARETSSLDDLVDRHGDRVLALELDVTDRDGAFAAVARAHEHFGQLDVVVNNAGEAMIGMLEEVTETDARAQMETNLFGALWVTQAALPILRAQGSGHLVQVSSEGGVLAFAGSGMYHASKWALEGMSQALAAEVAALGVRVTIVEPTGYATEFGARARQSDPIAAYDPAREEMGRFWGQRGEPGDPAATRQAILAVVDSDAPPLRVFLGDGPLDLVTADYESRLAQWRAWAPISHAAHGHVRD